MKSLNLSKINLFESSFRPNLAFTAFLFVQACLPYSRCKGHEFIRTNGNLRLALYSPDGLPYGSIPRLVIAFLVTEAVRKKSRTIYLGKNLSDFLSKLGLGRHGGKNGTITCLRRQINSLLTCYISCKVSGVCQNAPIDNVANMVVADRASLWWQPRPLYDESGKFQPIVVLSDKFYNSILESPIPVDFNIMLQLKKSPMALDIYCWLTAKAAYIHRRTTISWDDLALQFGATFKNVRHFRAAFRKHLKVVKDLYPAIRDKEGQIPKVDASSSKVLVLNPFSPSIPSKKF